jgi:HD-GYP domain-containing protein (c-di-GMP phosphodiesterase class II)
LRKINPELWLLLALVVIAAMLNFLVASQQMVLVFYFLPTLFSAYHFVRRHATLTALASIILVVLLVFSNREMFAHHGDLPFDSRWFDLTIWGGTLLLAGYSTGTLYERNQKTLREMEDGYDGMLVILQNFLASQKYSEAHTYRIAMCATKIAEGMGLDAGSTEDVRTAALLFNVNELGISQDVLCRAAQISEEELRQGMRGEAIRKGGAMGRALRRAIPIFLAEQQLRQSCASVEDASLEVQILVLAEEYEALTSGAGGAKLSPAAAASEALKSTGSRYDSLVVNGFAKAFASQAASAGA